MSLLVSIISKQKDVKVEHLEREIKSPFNDLFGFESWRKKLWGHESLAKIGCKIIIELKEDNVYVFDDDIQKLKQEFELVKYNIDQISEETKIDKETIIFRVNNALEAIKIVEKNKDIAGIALW